MLGVLGGLDVDAVGGTGGGAQETSYTLFETIFIALQDVLAAEAFLELGTFQRAGAVGIVLDDGRLEHFFQGDGHPLRDRAYVFDDRHRFLV